MGSTLLFVTAVLTSRTPSASRYVISYSWAKGQFAISSGYFQNSSLLVTHAPLESALISVVSQSPELDSMPCIAIPVGATLVLPSAELKVYFFPLAQNPPSAMRLAHGARNGMPLRPGLCFSCPTSSAPR